MNFQQLLEDLPGLLRHQPHHGVHRWIGSLMGSSVARTKVFVPPLPQHSGGKHIEKGPLLRAAIPPRFLFHGVVNPFRTRSEAKVGIGR